MNYDEMEAGPEMDRLVAEAMGYERKHYEQGVMDDYWECPVGGFIGYVSNNLTDFDTYTPSEDMNAAAVFAERFTESFSLFSPTKTSPTWLCSSIQKGVKATSLGRANTPSVAICRSVLKLLAKEKS